MRGHLPDRMLLEDPGDLPGAKAPAFGTHHEIGVRTRNGNLSTVRSSLLVDWSANALRRNAPPPSQSSWSFQYPFCRETSCNRVLERFLVVE